MIELRLLGPIQLRTADGHEVDAVLSQPKRLALLAYLASARPRGFHRRDKLVALFWPELDQRRARQALNKAVHHLRQSIGDAAIVSRGDDELALDDQILRCDVAQFENAVAEGRFLDALELYHGDLADGLYVDEAAELEQWLSVERERLRAVAAKAAGSAADAKQDADLRGAVEAARRALAFAPYDESALRRLMLLFERAGDRPAAVLTYNDFARRLRADLELEPSAEIRALRESLSREEPPVDRAPVVGDAPRPVAHAEEVERSLSRRRSRTLVTAVGATVFAGIVALAGWNRWSNRAAGVAVDANKVFVAILDNRTGDSTLNVVGAMTADWIVQGLASAGVAQVVREDSTHAGMVISGAFYKRGDSLLFQAQVKGAGSGLRRPFQPVVAPRDNPAAALESLREQALSLVAQATTPSEASLLRGSAKPPLYEAYREYIIGMDLYVRRNEQLAYRHFTRAAQLDTSFTVALLTAATSVEGFATPQSDSLVDALSARKTLSGVEQTWLDAMLARRRGDRGEVYDLVDRLARELPHSFFPYISARTALSLRRPRAAAERLRSFDRSARQFSGPHSYWVVLSMANHAAGDVIAEERDVQAARRELPDNPAVATAAARFLVSNGRLTQADSLLDEARSMPSRSDWNTGSVFAVAAAEAVAHGHTEWAARVRERAIRWYDQLPRADRDREVGFYGLTWILYSVGAWPQLDARLARLSREEPNNPRWIAFQGIVAAQKRDTSTARRFDEMLATRLHATDAVIPRRAEMLFDRARIAALLGDREAAIDLLREALARGLAFDAYLHCDPSFAALRDYGPFVRLIAPIG